MNLVFFARQDSLRRWLQENHDSVHELWVGLHKKGSGRPSITWPQLVDEVLCFGWIDGLRRSVDEDSYAIRITPRREQSNWSRVNTNRAQELIALGVMTPAGSLVFKRRDAESSRDSLERAQAQLGERYEADLRANQAAWDFFRSQPPWYRKTAAGWVVSAKREETRQRRLATLIEDSQKGTRIAPLRH